MASPQHFEDNFIDLARAEDFTNEDLLKCFTETSRERDLIERIKGPGAHLLEGPRGIGKSTLLKKAELELDEEFPTQRTLGVYVNFKAALLVDTGANDIGYNPFLCWIVAKVLDAFYKKSRLLNAIPSQQIKDKYENLFGISKSETGTSLEATVRDLQTLSSAATDQKKSEIIQTIEERGLKGYTNLDSVSDFIREIAKKNSIERVVFLFDEAAHTFNEQQQENFFEFFKLIHGDIVATKAAVYPGITTYGGNFEVGQDAIQLAFSSIDENLEVARADLINHFRELLEKRLPRQQYKSLTSKGEALNLLILLSNGNPRMFLQAASKLLAANEISKRRALAASNDFVSNELVNYHLGLKKRLPRFSSHIDLGMELIKGHLIPEIQKKNAGKGENPKLQTCYFTIDNLVPHKIKKSISLLEYSGFLFSKSVAKTANRKQSKRYALHLGVAANDKIFSSEFSRDPDRAIRRLSLTDYREFYASDPRFTQLVSDYPAQEVCPNGHPRQADGDFCPICGTKFELSPVLQELLNDSIEVLRLSKFLRDKITKAFAVQTVGDLLKLTESDLRRAYQIGPVRSRMLINIAEEYISG